MAKAGPKRALKYSTEFKAQAVKLSYRPYLQNKQVAEGLGIHPLMLSRWRKEYREGILQGDGKKRIGVNKNKNKNKKPTSEKKISEVAKLKKEIEQLKKENDLLKKRQQYLAEVRQGDTDSSNDSDPNQVLPIYVDDFLFHVVDFMPDLDVNRLCTV